MRLLRCRRSSTNLVSRRARVRNLAMNTAPPQRFLACDLAGQERRIPACSCTTVCLTCLSMLRSLPFLSRLLWMRSRCGSIYALLSQTRDRGLFLTTLTVNELLQFWLLADCRADLSNGHVFLGRRFPERSMPSTFYLHRSANLIICCAFDEIQPARYKAQLIAVLQDTCWHGSASS